MNCLYPVYVITLLEIAMVIYNAENISRIFIYLFNVFICLFKKGGHYTITSNQYTQW